MTDYGQNATHILEIPFVDEEPSVCGVKLSDLPKILAITVVPLWFSMLIYSIIFLILSTGLAYFAHRLELQGRPITLSKNFLRASILLPRSIRGLVLPSIGAISMPTKIYRR